jgi:hypothetical protein
MHPDVEVYVGHVMRKHIQPPQFPIGLTQKFKDFRIVDCPRSCYNVGLEAPEATLIQIFAGFEGFHELLFKIIPANLNKPVIYLRKYQKI